VRDSGRFRIPCKVGRYTMVIVGAARDGSHRVLGSAEVVVRNGETSEVRIRLDRGAQVGG
jgi:hypothetical protein